MIPELKKNLAVIRGADSATVSWPLYLTGYILESTDDLTTGVWTAVDSGVAESGTQNLLTILAPPPVRFFRLRKPADPATSGLVAKVATSRTVTVSTTKKLPATKHRKSRPAGKVN
jgi:hypothetical protein